MDKDAEQRRRKLAFDVYEDTLREGETYPDVILSTIDGRVEEEGLPPFVSVKETMQAINDQRAEEAKARRAMFKRLALRP